MRPKELEILGFKSFGYWWSPERKLLQTMIDASQIHVNGTVRVKLYKGNVLIAGRKSENSLFDMNIATFEDDAGASMIKRMLAALLSLMRYGYGSRR